MPEAELCSVKLDLQLAQGGDEELDQLTRQLRQELLEVGVESAELVHQGKAPAGAKTGLDPVVLGGLLVAVTPMVMTKLLEFLQAWTMRREGRTVKLNIQTADGASVQMEVPQTMSPVEVKSWIDTIEAALTRTKKASTPKVSRQAKA
jgi:hypothetical protein